MKKKEMEARAFFWKKIDFPAIFYLSRFANVTVEQMYYLIVL